MRPKRLIAVRTPVPSSHHSQGLSRHPNIVTVKELSRYLHVSPNTVYRLLKREELPAFRVGKRWRFEVRQIDEWRLTRSPIPKEKFSLHPPLETKPGNVFTEGT